MVSAHVQETDGRSLQEFNPVRITRVAYPWARYKNKSTNGAVLKPGVGPGV